MLLSWQYDCCAGIVIHLMHGCFACWYLMLLHLLMLNCYDGVYLLALLCCFQIKDYVENALKQLSVGTFFSKPSSVSHLEETIDNNVSARMAAHVAGFTQQHHSIVCTPYDNSQQCDKAPLHLEERGLFVLLFCIHSVFKHNFNCPIAIA